MKIKLPIISKRTLQKGFIRLSKNTLIAYLIISTVFVGTGIIFLFSPWSANKTEAAWFNDEWAYRQIATITNTGSAGSSYQVKIPLDTYTAITASKMQSDCDDVRVTDVNGNIYDSFVQNCSNVSGLTGSVWIKGKNIPAGTSNVYVYYGNPSASSRNGFTSQPNGIDTGNGRDGPITVSSNKNINADDMISGRTCSQGTGGDAVIFSSTANTSSGQNQIVLTVDPNSSNTCLAAGDEVLIINQQGTTGASVNVGQYETAHILSISTVTLTLSHNLIYGYDGTTQKINVQRVPNYTSVTINTVSTTDLTSTAWDGTKGGIVMFRATGTVSIAASTTINTNSLGYRGGAGGAAGAFGGIGGESFDGSGTTNAGQGSDGVTDNNAKGGGKSGDGTVASPDNKFDRGGGGGGGSDGSTNNNGAGGSGAGGGYGGGGGGGGGGSSSNSGNGGNGGAGGTTGIEAGGGAGGCGAGTTTAANGGDAGSSGGTPTCVNSGIGGAAGTGSVLPTSTGSGGGGGADTSGGGAGGGGGGRYGASTFSTLYLGSGGGGGGGSTDSAGADVPGIAGTDGGGIILISADTVTVSGGIQSNGDAATTSAAADVGNGGAGSGGAIFIQAKTATMGSSLVTATGGAKSDGGVSETGAGGGGVGRINTTYTSTTGSTSPADTTSQVPTAATASTEEKGTSPILYWKFDEGQGTTANDSTSSNLDGTLNNTPTWNTENFCIAEKCLYFDGANNENVSRADDAKLDFSETGNFTVSGWVKRNGTSSAINYIISKHDVTDDAEDGGYKLWMDADGDLCFGIDDDITWGPDHQACSDVGADYDDDKWHYVVGVRDQTGTDKIYVYVDGAEMSSGGTSDTTTLTLANSNIFYVGVDRDGTSNEWLGFIDDVKVYNFALTAAQIKTNFAARGNPDASGVLGTNTQNLPGALSNGLVGYWKMDENTGTSIIDSSGNSKTGTNIGTSPYIAGKYTYGISVDGVADAEDQHIELPVDSYDSDTEGSISMWIKPADSGGSAAQDFFAVASADVQNALEFRFTPASDLLSIIVTDGGALNLVRSVVLSSPTSWHHVVWTNSASGNALYVDGVKQTLIDGVGSATTNKWFDDVASGTTSYVFGCRAFFAGANDDCTDGFYNGYIDESRIYNRALSNSEVSQLYNFAPGPVGYWKLDEKAGNTAYDNSGNANDLSWENTPTSTIGKYGAAINLAGTDQRLARADDSDFDFGTGASFTYQAWIKHASTPSTVETAIIKFDSTAGNGGFELQIETDGDLTCGIDDDETSFPEATAVSTAATYDDNSWHHVACVKDGASTLALYIDGVLITSTSISGVTGDFANADPLYIGVDDTGTGSDWIGGIDEPKIYNYARTSAQVVEDMNAGHPAPGSPVGTPVGYWKFEEGALNRCSGGSNDACNSGSQGSTLDGAFNGNASHTNSGKFGKAIAQDGSGDYVSVTDNDAMDFSTNNFTASAWVKTSDTATTSIIGKQSGANAGWDLYAYDGTSTGDIFFTIYDGTNSVDSQLINTNISDGAWYHVAVVVDRTGGNAYGYLNGVLRGTLSISSVTGSVNNTDSVRIGGTQNRYWSGTTDEVKLFNSALTADQIKMDMNRSSGQVMGTLSSGSSNTDQSQAASQEYCIPGGTDSSCAGPVGRWDLEEGTGTTAYDSSATLNNLTLVGTPTYVPGKIGKGLNFAGTDQHLTTVADDADFDFSSSFTLEAWIRQDGSAISEYIITKLDTGVGNGGYRFRLDTSGNLVCEVDDDETSFPLDSVTSPDDYDDNAWHHVACVKNATTSLSIYADGVLVVTDTSITTGDMSNADPLYVGIDDDAAGQDWEGQMDNIKIFNYARSAAQVAWDYNKGKPVAHWKMDECQGTTINNSSGSSYTGTKSGSSTTGTCTTASTFWGGSGGTGAGKRNYAPTFDGTSDLVTLANAATFPANNAAQSISAWLYYASDPSGNDVAISLVNAGSSSHTAIQIRSSKIGVYKWGGTALVEVDRPATGTWFHISYTFDGTTNNLYINGVLVSTSATAPNTATPDAAYLGDYTSGGGEYWAGQIDDAKVYNYALTAPQVKLLFNDGVIRYGPTTGAP